jgi:hypothetical protein
LPSLLFKGSATFRCFALTLRSRVSALTSRFTQTLELIAFIQGLCNASPLRPHTLLAHFGARYVFHRVFYRNHACAVAILTKGVLIISGVPLSLHRQLSYIIP